MKEEERSSAFLSAEIDRIKDWLHQTAMRLSARSDAGDSAKWFSVVSKYLDKKISIDCAILEAREAHDGSASLLGSLSMIGLELNAPTFGNAGRLQSDQSVLAKSITEIEHAVARREREIEKIRAEIRPTADLVNFAMDRAGIAPDDPLRPEGEVPLVVWLDSEPDVVDAQIQVWSNRHRFRPHSDIDATCISVLPEFFEKLATEVGYARKLMALNADIDRAVVFTVGSPTFPDFRDIPGVWEMPGFLEWQQTQDTQATAKATAATVPESVFDSAVGELFSQRHSVVSKMAKIRDWMGTNAIHVQDAMGKLGVPSTNPLLKHLVPIFANNEMAMQSVTSPKRPKPKSKKAQVKSNFRAFVGSLWGDLHHKRTPFSDDDLRQMCKECDIRGFKLSGEFLPAAVWKPIAAYNMSHQKKPIKSFVNLAVRISGQKSTGPEGMFRRIVQREFRKYLSGLANPRKRQGGPPLKPR